MRDPLLPGEHRGEPARVQREAAFGSPPLVVRPRPLRGARHRACVEAGVDRRHRREGVPLRTQLDDRRDDRPPDRVGLELEPRAVQHESLDERRVPRCPERQREPARGVAHRHEPPALPGVLCPDRVERGGDVLVVGGQVAHVPGRLVRPQAPPVLPQVEGVEAGAEPFDALGELGLEEVVRPPVHVQDVDVVQRTGVGSEPVGHRPPPTDQGGDDRAFGVLAERELESLVRRAEDVLVPPRVGHASFLPHDAARRRTGGPHRTFWWRASRPWSWGGSGDRLAVVEPAGELRHVVGL